MPNEIQGQTADSPHSTVVESMERLRRAYRAESEEVTDNSSRFPPMELAQAATEYAQSAFINEARYTDQINPFATTPTPRRSRQVEEPHCTDCGTLLVKYKSKKVYRQSDGLHIQTMHKYECKSRLGWFGWFRVLSDLACPPQDINIVDYLDH